MFTKSPIHLLGAKSRCIFCVGRYYVNLWLERLRRIRSKEYQEKQMPRTQSAQSCRKWSKEYGALKNNRSSKQFILQDNFIFSVSIIDFNQSGYKQRSFQTDQQQHFAAGTNKSAAAAA